MGSGFEDAIGQCLKERHAAQIANEILNKSHLIKYIVYKTKSVDKDSKARSSFNNLFAIYVLIQDYIEKGYLQSGDYSQYEGARFVDLKDKIHKLPFGDKAQNHSLNARMNEEFKKLFPEKKDELPIVRNTKTKRYWIEEKYLHIPTSDGEINIAKDIIAVINGYVTAKQASFKTFIDSCIELQKKQDKTNYEGVLDDFVVNLLNDDKDARLFEIVSFAILKYFYNGESITWKTDKDTEFHSDVLRLYKTGRTNANDGGIDFVMQPLGRFFQVTETLDCKKYFLDIDKIERYKISFVVKSDKSRDEIEKKIKNDAKRKSIDDEIVQKYLDCIEEIINRKDLVENFKKMSIEEKKEVLAEIIVQSNVEFHLEEGGKLFPID